MSDARDLVTAGVDVGTSAVKVAVFRVGAAGGDRMLAKVTDRIRRREPKAIVAHCYEQALEAAGVAAGDVDYVASTGEGHVVDFRKGHFYGMTTHARGGVWLCADVDGVLDVGALHARAIRVDARSKVLGYRMTSQCASGTGQFVENIARYLGVTLDEVGPLSLEANAPERVSGICAVLAETDVINMVSRGISRPNIHESVCRALRRMEQAGEISRSSKGIRILARDKLAAA